MRSLSMSRLSTAKTSSAFSEQRQPAGRRPQQSDAQRLSIADRVMPLIFPALPGLAWSVTKSPTFQTRIQRAASGRELRALDYPYPLWQFTLVFDLLRDNPAAGYDELRTLIGFLHALPGRLRDVPVSRPERRSGRRATDRRRQCQCHCLPAAAHDGHDSPWRRLFGAIVAPNVVSAIYLNGTHPKPGSYSVDPNTGLVTFETAPGSGMIITADFSYYFRCRFVDDSYVFRKFHVSALAT